MYELIGGMIALMIDALHRDGRIRVVSMHHEQGAAFAAEGHSRMTGVPAVAMATSGPGATNLLTGIGSCYFDSTPAVFITGQVNRHELKGERAVRQLGFQETDIVSMAKPITKAAWQVLDPKELPAMLEKAFDLALSGRPGPVLIDIPMDVQRAELDEKTFPALPTPTPASIDVHSRLERAADQLLVDLQQARRPLILAGGGLRSGRANIAFRTLVTQLDIPVVHSLMGVDTLPFVSSQRVGLIGSYGNRWANLALDASDFLLVLGSRLDIRQTGADTESFGGDRRIVHVDCDPAEVNNRVTGCTFIQSDLKSFLHTLSHRPGIAAVKCPEWKTEIKALRDRWPDTAECNAGDQLKINPNSFMHALSAVSPLASAYVTDVGQHQMWSAQSVELLPHQRFLTSGGMGSMGFALPAAIGVACSTEGPVVVIAGDGGFQCNIQELETVFRNQLPLKMIILNNRTHGMVRQFQESYFDARYASTLWGYSAPDFAGIAKAYNIDSACVAFAKGIPDALAQCWKFPHKPFLLDVQIETEANAYPKLAFGKGLSSMEPLEKPTAMEGT